MLFNCTSLPDTKNLQPDIQHKIENSPQFKDGKFRGEKIDALDMSFGDWVSGAWDFLFTDNERVPDSDLQSVPVDLSHFNNTDRQGLTVTWLGHSSLMIYMDGYRILTDPVFEKRVSIVGPTRFNGDVPLDIEKLPEIDMVVISHDHYDHLNKFSIQRLQQKTALFLVPLAVGSRLEDMGIPRSKIVELDWWEEYRFDENLTFAATPAQHFSGRGLTDRNKTLWASWVILASDHRLFFSGDSGYFSGFKKIGEKYGPFDMTFLECGAYGKGWPGVHMFPEETVQAHLDLHGKVLHPIHWGTFNLALHPWYEPMERLTTAAESKGIQTATPVVGETTIYGKELPTAKWWLLGMEDSASVEISAHTGLR